MLIAYDSDGNITATLDHMVARDEDGRVTGLIDFGAHEDAGGEMTDVWTVSGAKGSKVWPEWLGSRAHDFRVELEGDPGRKRIGALVHRESGHRHVRADIEAAIEAVPVVNGARDIRHLVGGPDRPLHLDEQGRTAERPKGGGTPAHLPVARGR
jgi:hypothetical protein